MIDSSRALNNFGVTLKELEELVEKYRQRTYNEDIVYLDELGGTNGLFEKLGTSLERGITVDESDTKKREADFGSNYRAPT